MPSAEEIAERVRQADLQRIERRAERASAVADQAAALDEARARVQELTKELGSAVVLAAEVMELDELREFTDRTATEINEWAGKGGVPQNRHIKGGRRRSSGSSSGSRSRSRGSRAKSSGSAAAADASGSATDTGPGDNDGDRAAPSPQGTGGAAESGSSATAGTGNQDASVDASPSLA